MINVYLPFDFAHAHLPSFVLRNKPLRGNEGIDGELAGAVVSSQELALLS